jgi:hypothetical protein
MNPLSCQILSIYFVPVSSVHCFGKNYQFIKSHQISLSSSSPMSHLWNPFLCTICHTKPPSVFEICDGNEAICWRPFILTIFHCVLLNSLRGTGHTRQIWTDSSHSTVSLSIYPMNYLYHPRRSFDNALEDSAPPSDISQLTHPAVPGSESVIESAHRNQLMSRYHCLISNDAKLAARCPLIKFAEFFRNSSVFEIPVSSKKFRDL